MTSTCNAPAGARDWVRKIVCTVGTAMSARITTGMSVQRISSVVLPWTWRGGGAPSRRRNLMIV